MDVQAVQAGFEKDGWRLHHHLGRAAIDIDESWYDILVPGLTTTSKLSLRKQEVLQAHKKLVEAFWQALPVNTLKYGKKFVAGLPDVEDVMQTDEYALFSDRVLQAECDSMEKLHMMQEVPYLAQWQQANYAGQDSQQVAHHATSISTFSPRAREQSQLRSAEAAGTVSQEPAAKRQKIAHSVADKEQLKEAELEQLRSLRRHTELQLQIDTEKQAMLELGQQQEILRTRQLMTNAQGNKALTAQVMSASTSEQDVQPSNTPYTLELQAQAVLSCSSTAEDSTVPAAQPSKVKLNPELLKSKTIHGMYQEWVGGGQYASIKSYVVWTRRGWELSKKKGTQHTGAASDNLRRNVHLPEAIEHLVIQGLSEDAAVALVSQVVLVFGLTTIATQSEAFAELNRLEKAVRAGDAAQIAKVETKKLSKTSRTVREFKIAFEQARETDAVTWGAFLQQTFLT